MKKSVKFSWSFCWLLLFLGAATCLVAQPDAKKKPKQEPDCSYNAFHAEVAEIGTSEKGCKIYTINVTTDGGSRYDLSHFTIELPCGSVMNVSNSRNWKVETGKDPTTGLKGFKIDDISSFGKSPGDSFTVEYTICSNDNCDERPGVVAYKFGQCVKYENLIYKDDDGGGDDGGGDDGGGDGGGDNGNCSTLLASLKETPILCYGLSGASLEVVIESGNAPFTYSWSNGATGALLQNIIPGTYAVTVVDADGNTLTLNSEISQPEQLIISETVQHPSCNLAGDGAIMLSVTGGTEPYSFLWGTGSVSSNLEGVNAGVYTVAVSDAAGCSIQKSIVLTNTIQINLSATTIRTACGQSSGAIDLSVSGGALPYTFFWSNGATTEDIQSLKTGSYRVVVTDANGCQSIGNYFVQENSDLRIAFAVQKPNCANEPTGSIDITVTGGVGPYAYSWQHGPTTEDIEGISSGIYRVTVTDNLGCAALATILVQKNSLQVSAQVAQPMCANDSNGSVSLTPTNGASPYTYEWSNGTTDSRITDVPEGTYTVTVRDASGCSVTLTYTLTSPNSITIAANISNGACGADGSYKVNAVVSGGKPPYQYLWSNGQTTSMLSNLSAGTYQVQVTDANGCTAVKEVEIKPESFSWTCIIEAPINAPVCQSVGNNLSASIQNASYYSWNVTSSDNSWKITSGANAGTVIYSAGNMGSTATFTLTMMKDGCTQSCSYNMEGSCDVRDNTGGGDPNNGDPCSEVVVNENQKTVSELTADEKVTEEEEVEEEEVEEKDSANFEFVAYPNPFEYSLRFEWTADVDDYVRLEIYDQHGRLLKEVYAGSINAGEKYHVEWLRPEGKEQLYFYRFTSQKQLLRGKVFSKKQ